MMMTVMIMIMTIMMMAVRRGRRRRRRHVGKDRWMEVGRKGGMDVEEEQVEMSRSKMKMTMPKMINKTLDRRLIRFFSSHQPQYQRHRAKIKSTEQAEPKRWQKKRLQDCARHIQYVMYTARML